REEESGEKTGEEARRPYVRRRRLRPSASTTKRSFSNDPCSLLTVRAKASRFPSGLHETGALIDPSATIRVDLRSRSTTYNRRKGRWSDTSDRTATRVVSGLYLMSYRYCPGSWSGAARRESGRSICPASVL